MSAVAGAGAHAGMNSGGSSIGGTSSGGGTGGTAASGGTLAMGGSAGALNTAGAVNGGESSGGAGANAAGAAGFAGAPPSVVDVMCVRDSDCLAACNANGWPLANCFGAEKRYCFCKSNSGTPSCVNGTTEGCPAGMQCRGTSGCTPYGTATDGVPCENGDECAVDYTCVRYGNPLPNGESSACRRWCQSGQPLPPDCYSCTSGVYCDPRPEGAAGTGG